MRFHRFFSLLLSVVVCLSFFSLLLSLFLLARCRRKVLLMHSFDIRTIRALAVDVSFQQWSKIAWCVISKMKYLLVASNSQQKKNNNSSEINNWRYNDIKYMLTMENEACLRMRYRFRFYHLHSERKYSRSQMFDNFMIWIISFYENNEANLTRKMVSAQFEWNWVKEKHNYLIVVIIVARFLIIFGWWVEIDVFKMLRLGVRLVFHGK